MEQNKIKPLYIVVGVVVAVAMIAGIAALTVLPGTKREETAQSTSTAPARADSSTQPSAQPSTLSPEERAKMDEVLRGLARRDPEDPAARGEVDAPVVMIQWADFRCKFCQRFAQETLPELEPYIASGDVRYEFRDFAIFGQESLDVAIAARAAGQQGRHYEFMKAYYAAAAPEGQAAAPEHLTQVAEEAGVENLDNFQAGLEDPALENTVWRDSQEAQQFGFTSVPVFIIGTQIVRGAQPTELFVQAVEQEIEKAS